MEPMTLLEEIEWYQDPLHLCAGQPIIPATRFAEFSKEFSLRPDFDRTEEEILAWLYLQSKRFVACGGNHAERFALIRKNPKSGWQYVIDYLNKKEPVNTDS